NSFGGVAAPAGAVPLVLNGNIGGTGTLAFNTAGSLYELNGNNTYQGDTFVNQGLISITSDANLGNGTNIQFFNASSTEGIFLRGDWTTSKSVHNRGGWAIDTNGFTATLNGMVFGGGAITKNDLGTLVLTAPCALTAGPSLNA